MRQRGCDHDGWSFAWTLNLDGQWPYGSGRSAWHWCSVARLRCWSGARLWLRTTRKDAAASGDSMLSAASVKLPSGRGGGASRARLKAAGQEELLRALDELQRYADERDRVADQRERDWSD
jgi:hypothetical protein